MVATTNETGGGMAQQPDQRVSPIQWLRENLFNNWYNAILTIVALAVIYMFVAPLWQWGIVDSVWDAENYRECLKKNPDGACWAGVIVWFNAIIYGRFPAAEQWRINLAVILLAVWLAPLWLPRVKLKTVLGLSTVVFYPFLAAYLFMGGDKGIFLQVMLSAAILVLIANTVHAIIGVVADRSLPEAMVGILGLGNKSDGMQRNVLLLIFAAAFVVIYLLQMGWTVPGVSWVRWGGLFLTLVISGVGITTALPGGILLALGRRSKLPVIRVLSITFIELFRSVPLITVLFMATTMFPLFLPEGFQLNKLVQVIVAVCLFSACYMAEIVRGGLQAIPKGQYEAAHAMGLSYWKSMSLIIMPQALKYMIPNIVGSFMGLLKDTTLVTIIGLFDILNMIQAASQDVPWRGLHKEPLLIGASIFFVLCFAMSKYSQRLETKLSTDHDA
ncbi:MAG: amino acid ABC transporter permease [Alphaproteobacteria bacterium]|nr:amino acid ABC transporter permease [Alphaproteobacteria bacterium]